MWLAEEEDLSTKVEIFSRANWALYINFLKCLNGNMFFVNIHIIIFLAANYILEKA